MRKISIGYFADGVWGLNSLKKILKQNKINIKFVCLRYRTPDKKILRLVFHYAKNRYWIGIL